MKGITRQFRVVGQDDDQTLRLAFATDDGKHVNQHFGTASSFIVYGVKPESSHVIAAAEFEGMDAEQTEDKLTDKLEFLDGCIAVYCRACGASAVRKLLQQHVQPLKVVDNSQIGELIDAFQQELNEGPSSWLAKAIVRAQNTQCRGPRHDVIRDPQ